MQDVLNNTDRAGDAVNGCCAKFFATIACQIFEIRLATTFKAHFEGQELETLEHIRLGL